MFDGNTPVSPSWFSPESTFPSRDEVFQPLPSDHPFPTVQPWLSFQPLLSPFPFCFSTLCITELCRMTDFPQVVADAVETSTFALPFTFVQTVYNNAFVHARAPAHHPQPRTLIFLWRMRNERPSSSVVLQKLLPDQSRAADQAGSNPGQPRSTLISPFAAQRCDFCRETQGGREKSRSRLGQNGHAACMCDVRHMQCEVRCTSARVHVHCYAIYTAFCALPTMHSCTRALPSTIPNRAHSYFYGECGMKGRRRK